MSIGDLLPSPYHCRVPCLLRRLLKLLPTHPEDECPEDEVNAAKEAIHQAGIMMEKMKMVRDASQAAYDASSALQSNVQVSWSPLVLLGYAT